MKNIHTVAFRDIMDTALQQSAGHLVPIEAEHDIPFPIQRVYYIFGVDQHTRRGFHSHRLLEQMLICMHGSIKIDVKTPYEQQIISLDSPTKGLYIGPMIWREMFDFSPGAMLLVLASEYYDPADYIRDYSEYVRLAERYFST